MNKKRTMILLAIGVTAVGLYLLYRYIQSRGSNGGSGALGTNLNSVAPELIGGSSGPTQGPAVQVPVNITVTSQDAEGGNRGRSVNPPPQTAGGTALGLMNSTGGGADTGRATGAAANRGVSRETGTPMRSAARHQSPMHAQHRAASVTAGTNPDARDPGAPYQAAGTSGTTERDAGTADAGAGASRQHRSAEAVHTASRTRPRARRRHK